jgi:hypothetical protein
MKKRILYLLLPIITLILEILPYGAVCNFAMGPGQSQRKLFSYFDLVPFGYANFAPLLTALSTCAIFLLLVLYCFIGKKGLLHTVKIILCISTVVSCGPLLFGLRYFSLVGALISFSLVAELLLLQFTDKSRA